MPRITIDGREIEFTPGQSILQAALANDVDIPFYCYHPELSVPASCRICLAEVWAPNPRNENKLEPIPKLLPTCQTPCGDGHVVHSKSPRALQNQKAVMEYLLLNHPLDCPVCDQAGECLLQDYSYEHGRGVSRFEEDKIKQPKKDVGPNILLYADRCIMCSRCVRFTREISGTAELTIDGRGAFEQIDVFPGKALDNPIAGNVVDICPVGALLDKRFLFQQRVWFLKRAASIDGVTSSGDNIWIEHNDGVVRRIIPRTNEHVNRTWITDEVRYSYEHIHDERRLRSCRRREYGAQVATDYVRAVQEAVEGLAAARQRGRIAVVVSPMLACEEAYALATLARALGETSALIVGPVASRGDDQVFPPGAKPAAEGGAGFVARAEKAPNARGVRRVLAAHGPVMEWSEFAPRIGEFAGVLLTGCYPSEWAAPEFVKGLEAADASRRAFVVLADILQSRLADAVDVVLAGATWAEKAGCFENATGRVQAFHQAIPPIDGARAEGQIALDMLGELTGEPPEMYDAAALRGQMSEVAGLELFASEVHMPAEARMVEGDMAVVEL